MVVLATKCYVSGDARRRALDGMGSLVENAIGDLEVTWTVDVRDDDFVTVELDGEDATVARNVLREEWGEIPGPETGFDAGEVYHGTLEGWTDDGFVLDAGHDVLIPADELGLGPGAPEQVVERFGLVQHLPMQFVWGGDDQSHRLADGERDRLYDWQRGPGRVNVNSVTRGEARAAVNRAGHAHDIVTVERLGLLEQSIICTEDTDPPGLLASIGSRLPAEMRCVV